MILLLGKAPRCGMGGEQGFGKKEEKVAGARDDEVHGESPTANLAPHLAWGVHLYRAR